MPLDDLQPGAILFDVFNRDIANDESVPIITNMRDVLGNMLYVQADRCNRCYPVTNYCRGHVGKIMFDFYHIRYVYKQPAALLCSLICDRCYLPINNNSSTLSIKKVRLLMQLYQLYGNSSCICTGANAEAKDKPSQIGKLSKVYNKMQQVDATDDLHTLFRLGDWNQVAVQYVAIVPFKLLEQIPNGSKIMSCYANILQSIASSTLDIKEKLIAELYDECEKAVEGKQGLMRQYVLPRRVPNSSRAVIISDPTLGLCDVGVPQSMFRSLYSEELVTSNNVWRMVTAIGKSLAFAVTYQSRRYKLISSAVVIRISGCILQHSTDTTYHSRDVVTGTRVVTADTNICLDNSNHEAFTKSLKTASKMIEPDGTVVGISPDAVYILYVLVSASSSLAQIDTSCHRLQLQEGCIVSVCVEGHKILLHRNPVLSAGSLRVHYMVPILSPKSTYMSQLERYEQRVQLVNRRHKTLLGTKEFLATQQHMHTTQADTIVGESITTDAKSSVTRYKITSANKSVVETDVDTSCCLSLNPLSVTTYQGDFDGDEINSFSLNGCSVGDVDMTLIGDLMKGTFGPIHDAMYGLYCLTYDKISIEQLLHIPTCTEQVVDILVRIMQDTSRLSICTHKAFNSYFCNYIQDYALRLKLVAEYMPTLLRATVEYEPDDATTLRMCLQKFYADIGWALCYLCDRVGIYFNASDQSSIDSVVASDCKPKAATRDTIYKRIGRVTYVLPDNVRVSYVSSNYGQGVTEDEYTELCYSNRLQAANKALATAPEGENMRLQCSYMSDLNSKGDMWYCNGGTKLIYEKITQESIMCFKEDELLSEMRTYYELVDDNSRQLPYRMPSELPVHIAADKSRIRHIGQRKLLMSEIDFLTDYATVANCIVVYAGAASGAHINVLLQLFANVEFHLYDTAEFSSVLFNKINNKPRDRIIIHREYLTAENASRYMDESKHILFISDIRNNSSYPQKPSDADVDADNTTNWQIIQAMQPVACMLKFRLPYAAGYTVLPYGERRLQCWCGVESTEVRLVATRPYTEMHYNHRTHEQIMYAHNLVRPYEIAGANVSEKLLASMDIRYRYYDMYRETSIVAKYVVSRHMNEPQVYAYINDTLGVDRR